MVFNKEIEVVIKDCRDVAIDLGSDHLSSYHFIIALLKTNNFPNEIFKNKNWNFIELYKSMLEVEKKKCKNYYLTLEFEKALKNAKYYSWIYNVKEVKSEHIILALLADRKSYAGEYLRCLGMNYFEFKTQYEKIKKQNANKFLEKIGTNKITIALKIPNIAYDLFNKNAD
jgi:ATP-dependent Clp protease ATP-binding subunit ClpA